jgi:hypothetical protein
MRRVAIGPTDRLRCFVVAVDVSTNLASQVGNGGEGAARQQVSLDLRKPEFDLVEPGRIGRGEVQMYVRVLEQEGAHGLRLMGREIVRDDVNRSPLRLTGDDVIEEVDKGRTRVPRHGLAEHFARLGVESGEQRKGAVPVVLEAVARPGDSGSTGSRRSSA